MLSLVDTLFVSKTCALKRNTATQDIKNTIPRVNRYGDCHRSNPGFCSPRVPGMERENIIQRLLKLLHTMRLDQKPSSTTKIDKHRESKRLLEPERWGSVVSRRNETGGVKTLLLIISTTSHNYKCFHPRNSSSFYKSPVTEDESSGVP